MNDNTFVKKCRKVGINKEMIEEMFIKEAKMVARSEYVGEISEIILSKISMGPTAFTLQSRDILFDMNVYLARSYKGPIISIKMAPLLGKYFIHTEEPLCDLVEDMLSYALRTRWGNLEYLSSARRFGYVLTSKGKGNLCLSREQLEPFIESIMLSMESELYLVKSLSSFQKGLDVIGKDELMSAVGADGVDLTRGVAMRVEEVEDDFDDFDDDDEYSKDVLFNRPGMEIN